MAENLKIERVVDNDGRRVETHSYEQIVNGQKERVTETHIEKVPMVISERVVEKIAPIVTTRKIERYKNGELVDSVIEELDNGSMKMAVAPPSQNYLTKEDLIGIIREVMGSSQKMKNVIEIEPIQNTKMLEWVEMGMYVILSSELAFCIYHLILKNWL